MAEEAKQPTDKPVHLDRVRMTFGEGTVVGILVQTIDIHHNIRGNNKWYGSLFRMIAPMPIMRAFISASSNLDNILLTGEDGTRYRIHGVRSRFVEASVAAQDMCLCEGMAVDIDEIIPLEQGPTHYENRPEQAVLEASGIAEEQKDSAGEEAATGVGGETIQDQGKNPS